MRWTCLEGDGLDPIPGVVVQPSTSGILPTPPHTHTRKKGQIFNATHFSGDGEKRSGIRRKEGRGELKGDKHGTHKNIT